MLILVKNKQPHFCMKQKWGFLLEQMIEEIGFAQITSVFSKVSMYYA